jgi:hypothetical protein
MKRFLLVAAALALAGSATAQSPSQFQGREGGSPIYGVQRPQFDDVPQPPIQARMLGSIKSSSALRGAEADFRQACEPDRLTLCDQKAGPEASTRCILRQRSKLSPSCGKALTTLADLENVPLGRP